MVHQIRKGLKKTNAVVYGCCSDGYRFDFLQIDNESRVRVPFNIELSFAFYFVYIASTNLV